MAGSHWFSITIDRSDTDLEEVVNYPSLSLYYCKMVEPLLSGIVLGLIPVTLVGLMVAAYLQYRRGNQFGL